MQQDKLSIHQLEVAVTMGVYPHERLQPQPLYLDIALFYDSRFTAETDALHHAIDYDLVVSHIKALSQEVTPDLIETFAAVIARDLLQHFPLCARTIVAVHKPQAIPAAKDVYITIERTRADFT